MVVNAKVFICVSTRIMSLLPGITKLGKFSICKGKDCLSWVCDLGLSQPICNWRKNDRNYPCSYYSTDIQYFICLTIFLASEDNIPLLKPLHSSINTYCPLKYQAIIKKCSSFQKFQQFCKMLWIMLTKRVQRLFDF